MANQPDITLYTAQTPNGIKISIALEELGYVHCLSMPKLTRADCHRLPYKVEKIDISKNTQKEPYALFPQPLSWIID